MTDAKYRYRVSNWFDINAMIPKFGVQARGASGRWMHTVHNGEAAIFDTQDEAEALIRSLSTRMNEGEG